MKTLAIIITAYKTEKFILKTLESLKNQILPEGWQIKFYIGVDACKDTASTLKENKVSYYYSKENVGTYILTNSLLEKAKLEKCDMFVRFDSDDVALENFLMDGITNTEKNNFTTTVFVPCDKDLNLIVNKEPRWAHGSMFFTKKILNLVGGFHHYRVSCDKFFNLRVKGLGFKGRCKNPPKYFYRIHERSLTGNEDTKLNSVYRNDIEKSLVKSLENKEFKIEPVTTTLIHNQF